MEKLRTSLALIALLRNGNEVEAESILDLHRWNPALLMRRFRAPNEG